MTPWVYPNHRSLCQTPGAAQHWTPVLGTVASTGTWFTVQAGGCQPPEGGGAHGEGGACGDRSPASHVTWGPCSTHEGDFGLHVRALGKSSCARQRGWTCGRDPKPGFTGLLDAPRPPGSWASSVPSQEGSGASGRYQAWGGRGPRTPAGPICRFKTLFAFSANRIFICVQHWLFHSAS